MPGEFPTQRPVTRSFDVFFDLHPNKRLSKQWWGWWFETPSCPLWRHCNGNIKSNSNNGGFNPNYNTGGFNWNAKSDPILFHKHLCRFYPNYNMVSNMMWNRLRSLTSLNTKVAQNLTFRFSPDFRNPFDNKSTLVQLMAWLWFSTTFDVMFDLKGIYNVYIYIYILYQQKVEYLDNGKTRVFGILICWKWFGTNHKEMFLRT